MVIHNVLTECRRSRITAMIIHSDPDAAAVARTCADRGVSIPDDLALISYDDEAADLADPSLTAVRPPKNHVGRLAVELMVSRLLDGERRPAQRVLVAPELVVRQSSLPARGGSVSAARGRERGALSTLGAGVRGRARVS
jgi:DNA-binding LacI/PurR family transcriptional regulator